MAVMPVDPILAIYGPSTAAPTIATATIQSDYLAIARTTLSLNKAMTIATSINAGTTTETAYVNSLLAQVANTTIPAVAVLAARGATWGDAVGLAHLQRIARRSSSPFSSIRSKHLYLQLLLGTYNWPATS